MIKDMVKDIYMEVSNPHNLAIYPPDRSVFFSGYLCSVSFYDCIIKGRLQYLVFVSYFSSRTPASTVCVSVRAYHQD